MGRWDNDTIHDRMRRQPEIRLALLQIIQQVGQLIDSGADLKEIAHILDKIEAYMEIDT
jgi:hypothetical protein